MRTSVEEIQRYDERWRVEQEQNCQRRRLEGNKGGEEGASGFRISKTPYCKTVDAQASLWEVLEKTKRDEKPFLWELSDHYSIMFGKINIKVIVWPSLSRLCWWNFACSSTTSGCLFGFAWWLERCNEKLLSRWLLLLCEVGMILACLWTVGISWCCRGLKPR